MYKILANTRFIGKNLIYMPQCHSTNAVALAMSKKGDLEAGTVVVTDHQTSGRGQRGSTWVSERGENLLFSIFFKPLFLSPDRHFWLNAAVSLGIYDYLAHRFGAAVQIKWPNDTLLHRAKVCGVLLESRLRGDRFAHVVAGVGLNVNQLSFKGLNASSMRLFSGKAFALDRVLAALLAHIERRYRALEEKGYAALCKPYTDALFGLGAAHAFRLGTRSVSGIIRGVDATGRLVVEIDGARAAFGFKEIGLVL